MTTAIHDTRIPSRQHQPSTPAPSSAPMFRDTRKESATLQKYMEFVNQSPQVTQLKARIAVLQSVSRKQSNIPDPTANTRPGAPMPNPSGSAPVIQCARYVRALNGDGRVANEITSLRRLFVDETNREHQVNTWVNGFAGMPTARFTTADRHYYSPVGYILETNSNDDVLANYRGDGNTNDIPVGVPGWVGAAQALRLAVQQVEDYTEWAAALEDDPWSSLPEVDDQTGVETRNTFINYFLTPYLRTADDATETRAAGKLAVRNAITNTGMAALRTHYGQPVGATQIERFIGTGVNPDGMQGAIDAPDVRYIESILHARFNQVVSAWYNQDLGAYADAAAQANWRTGDDWLANRRTSAEAVRDAFNQAGANIAVEVIGPAQQEEQEEA